jgi:hypothetical protein
MGETTYLKIEGSRLSPSVLPSGDRTTPMARLYEKRRAPA